MQHFSLPSRPLGPCLGPCLGLCLGLLSALLPASMQSHAAAQADAELSRGAILRTQIEEGAEESLGGAVDRIVRSRLDSLGVMEIHGSVALNLADVQLALGCVGETEPCLRAVAEELNVSLLLLPSLTRAGSETIVSISLFERGGEPALRSVSRRISSEEGDAAILDSIEGQLRELFGLPEVVEREGGEGDPTHDPETPIQEDPSLIGPLLLSGLGVALIGVGFGLGAASADALNAYRNHPTGSEAEVDDALDLYGQAEGYAIGANLLFGLGGAAALGGVIWLIAELSSSGPSAEQPEEAEEASTELTLLPSFGPTELGLRLAGTLPEAL